MDGERFDLLARSVGITASRRGALRVLASSMMGFAAVRLGLRAEPVEAEDDDADDADDFVVYAENLFGCKNVGETCQNNTDCCSNKCEGAKKKKKKNKKGKNKKKDRKGTCEAHNQGGCSGQNACSSTGVQCGDSGFNGVCFQTTGNAPFCGRSGGVAPPGFQCATCGSDADCQNILGWPSDSACIVCDDCQFITPNSTACVGPAAG